MAEIEIESFVRKFITLWSSGYEASLDLSCKLGEVSISLKCNIGRNVSPPSPSFGKNPYRNGKRPSLSRLRRQARRAAARDETANVVHHENDAVEESIRVDDIQSIETTGDSFEVSSSAERM